MRSPGTKRRAAPDLTRSLGYSHEPAQTRRRAQTHPMVCRIIGLEVLFAGARVSSQAQMPEESPLTPFKFRLPNGKFAIDLDDDSGPATGHPVVQKDKKGLISCLTCGTRMWLV